MVIFMANNLAKLRKEFKLTQNDLANLLNTTSTNIGYYEQEKRDFSTKLLFTLSDLFQVSIDYLLANSNKGIKIYYDGDVVLEFIISDEMLDELLKRNVVYYLNDSLLLKQIQVLQDLYEKHLSLILLFHKFQYNQEKL